MPLNPQKKLTLSKIKPVGDPDLARTRSVRLPGGVNYPAGQILEEVASAAQTEVQTLTFGGTITGGSIQLTAPNAYGGTDTSPAIAWSGTGATLAANIQAGLNTLLGAGNVVVTGTGPFTLTFAGDLANRFLPNLGVVNSLTGTGPTAAVTEATAGHPGGVVHQALNAGTARAVLECNARTDFAGNAIDEFGAGSQGTFPAFVRGEFAVDDLVGLTSTAAGQLGKMRTGSYNAAGSILALL